MVHKKIIEKALSQLDSERASYFGVIARSLEEDRRVESHANLVYSVLKDVMADLPVYLEPPELIELLLVFTQENYEKLRQVLYDPDFIKAPSSIRNITGVFVHQVAMASLEKHQNGDIKEEIKPSVHKLTWPYRATDVLDPEEDPQAWGDAIARSEAWIAANNGVDRREFGTARIDEIASEKLKEAEEREKSAPASQQKELKITDL